MTISLDEIINQYMPSDQSVREISEFFAVFSQETRVRLISLLSIGFIPPYGSTIILWFFDIEQKSVHQPYSIFVRSAPPELLTIRHTIPSQPGLILFRISSSNDPTWFNDPS